MKNELIMNTEEFVKNRKYVAIMKYNRPYLWDSHKAPEGFTEEYGIETFCFKNFTHSSKELDGHVYLYFDDSFFEYIVRLDDVVLYKKEEPPIINKIKNKFEQNQI